MAQQRLLSIDGGGIRGIIPVCALIKLERLTGKPTRDMFGLIAGTSTGAIIAAGLAAGISAEELLELYRNRAPRIFRKDLLSYPRRIFRGSLYSTTKLHDLLVDALGPAGEQPLNALPIDVLITATELADGRTWYFVRDNPHNSGRTGHLKLADCVTASTAEPTYFQPWIIREIPAVRPAGSRPIGKLVGGGVSIAGNPIYEACVQAFSYTGDRFRPEETIVVSLGTGRYATRASEPGWIWGWLQWVLRQLLRSPGEQQTEIVWRQFPATPVYRLDIRLNRDVELDDTGSIDELQRYGERLADSVEWGAILDGTDTTFRVGVHKTRPAQYSVP